ncbi:MAG: putative N-acetyl-LL-diaminopimelate aminotransferase [Planctomycetes bacterium ADurb.Bin126]|nr:MAG: putative N-acetyl-LL-diaminopimelate aminotransferase [Planctomycetes bacterium ADurb.Bin126]HOD79772.1 pyridoxal phosphate-dependent aminotransferase [Phycisphaerae bacterium]HQL76470.1 pyridoxal phosphate-dependent aminotransferase [Phycisphaerae bacterium]
MTRPSHRIADRMSQLDASGIRKVFDLAARLKDPINLSIGQPDFDVPASARERAVQAIREGMNKYTQTQGTAELRNAIAQACKAEFGWDDGRDYLITSGVSGALLLAMMTLVNPGDEVVFADPYFVMYSHLINLCGGKPVPVSTYDDFRPDVQRLADAITDRTRMLIINSPANPTGAVYSQADLRQIADLAAKRDLLVISDEIYNFFCYDEPFVSMASLYENTLLLRGFSKSYAMTGWRIGWCTGPKTVLDKMTMLQQYSFVCAPSMAQAGALAALDLDMTAEVEAYRRKRDMVQAALGPALGLVKPGGAFYAFPPAPGGDANAFVTRAIEHNVLIIPGNVFSTRNTHFRISYATTDEKLAQGLEILVKLARS